MSDLNRSKSWKPPQDTWRPSTGLQRGTTSASENWIRRQPQHGHHRSQSGASTLDSPVEQSVGWNGQELGKSASLRSTTSHAGGYARSVLTRGRASPGAAANWEYFTGPGYGAKSEDNHALRLEPSPSTGNRGIPGPLSGMGQLSSPTYAGFQGIQEREREGADVRRHQSLQQGFGHSTKVRERLARSQALLPPDQRTPLSDQQPPSFSSRERRPSELSGSRTDLGRNVWATTSGSGDGWAQVDVAMRARQGGTPPFGHQAGAGGGRRSPPPNVHQREKTTGQYGMGDGYPGARPQGPVDGYAGGREELQRDAYQPRDLPRDGYQSREGYQPREPPREAYRADPLAHAFAGISLEPSASFPAFGAQTPTPDLYRTYSYTPGYPDAGGGGEYPSYGSRQVDEYPPFPPQAPQGYAYANPPVIPPLPIVSPSPAMQQSTSFAQQQQQLPVVPDHIARAAEYEVHQMIAKRRLNPVDFHCEPENARFFVIKSFTEDDVHKSLKHEIWSSTTYGNQRLDRAFSEARGPVYLFFSVNGSGHFCGVAQMISPVDYNQTSTVWAQDKWKGILKLRWIFVKDIPNGALRHIRLMNTQEQKPITNSRDTQELLWDAGCEVLAIFSKFREKTSLLQDWGFHEMQALEKAQRQQPGSAQHTPTIPAGFDAQEMPPLPHVDARHAPAENTSDAQRGVGKPGLVKGFSATGPPSLSGPNQGFSVVSRGNKAVTKIF